MERKRLTMDQVVGANVRAIRAIREVVEDDGSVRPMTQKDLRAELQARGVTLSRPVMAQLESGGRPTSVSELLALGLVLEVAPHLLLYPPGGTDVVVGDEVLPGPKLAEWLLEPDNHRLTRAGETEQRRWADSVGLADRLSPKRLAEIREELAEGWDDQEDQRSPLRFTRGQEQAGERRQEK